MKRVTKGRLSLHFLTGYAPELNPDELVWSDVKRVTATAATGREARGVVSTNNSPTFAMIQSLSTHFFQGLPSPLFVTAE
jgi:hypothetical protein